MIKDIFLFANGMVAVCDENGNQVMDCQGRYQDVVERLRSEDLSGAAINVMLWRAERRDLTPEQLLSLWQGPNGQIVESNYVFGGAIDASREG
jgi:hypothetical protein